MKTTLIASAILSLWALGTSAAISTGSQLQGGTTMDIAWIEGDDPCSLHTNIVDAGSSACGRTFTLRNGRSYSLQNCGTDGFAIYDEPGTVFNHKCKWNSQTIDCHGNGNKVSKTWTC